MTIFIKADKYQDNIEILTSTAEDAVNDDDDDSSSSSSTCPPQAPELCVAPFEACNSTRFLSSFFSKAQINLKLKLSIKTLPSRWNVGESVLNDIFDPLLSTLRTVTPVQ